MKETIVSNSNDLKKESNRLISNENITVDHFKAAVVLVTVIQKCPMDEWCKKVMLRRVGRPWEGLMPKTPLQIALELGCTEKEVKEIEEVGKACVDDFIKRCCDMALSKNFEKNIANEAFKQENTDKTIIT